MADYQRVHCFPCGGSGYVKGRAKGGSSDAVGRRKLKSCPDCRGRGYTEERVRQQVCDCQAPIVESGAAGVSEDCPIHAPPLVQRSVL